MWKIQGVVSKGDYNYTIVPDHPNCTNNGYVLEHRVVMENHLGRILNSNEVVHHKNGDGKDNRLENLEVKTLAEHAQKHTASRGSDFVDLKCPWCGKVFSKRYNYLWGKEYSCCSRHCKGCFSRKMQLHGRTPEVDAAISGNIVRRYIKYLYDNPEETANDGIRRGHTRQACDGQEMVQTATREK